MQHVSSGEHTQKFRKLVNKIVQEKLSVYYPNNALFFFFFFLFWFFYFKFRVLLLDSVLCLGGAE